MYLSMQSHVRDQLSHCEVAIKLNKCAVRSKVPHSTSVCHYCFKYGCWLNNTQMLILTFSAISSYHRVVILATRNTLARSILSSAVQPIENTVYLPHFHPKGSQLPFELNSLAAYEYRCPSCPEEPGSPPLHSPPSSVQLTRLSPMSYQVGQCPNSSRKV